MQDGNPKTQNRLAYRPNMKNNFAYKLTLINFCSVVRKVSSKFFTFYSTLKTMCSAILSEYVLADHRWKESLDSNYQQVHQYQ